MVSHWELTVNRMALNYAVGSYSQQEGCAEQCKHVPVHLPCAIL